MSLNETQADHLLAKVATALASNGNLTAARPLCEVIAFLAQQDGCHIQDALGKSLGTSLLRFFLNSANTLLLRRWSGLLLYELCRTSERTVELLVGQRTTTTSQLNGLGRMIQLQDDREDLMLVSCMIMSEVSLKNVDQHILWPSQTEGATFIHGNAQEWMVGLQTVLDSFSESQASHANMFYPRAVHADQDLFFDEQKGRLLMLMEDRLTVVVAPPAAAHTFYVDIPFENIHGAAISSELEVCLDLVSTSGFWTYVVNAEPYRTEAVSIELATAAQAQLVLEEVRQRCNLGRASYQQELRSARSSSAALVFDGTPTSDDMGTVPPSTFFGAAEEPLQAHDAPSMTEARHDAVNDELAPRTRLKYQVSEQQNINGDMNSGDEEQENDEVDQVAVVPPPELARYGLGRSTKENATRPSTKHTETRTKDEASIYSLPEESPGPTLQPEQPRKTKGKGDGGATQPAPQPRKRESKGKTSQGRKRQSGQKRKPEETESNNGDDEYRPEQQQRISRQTSGRVTRASAARKLHANGRQSEDPTVSEQVAETALKPRNGLPPVQQSSGGINQEAHTSVAERKARHQPGSRQKKHHLSESIEWEKPQLLPPRDWPIKLKSEEEAPGDDGHYVTHSEVEGGVGNEHPAILNPGIVKTNAINKKIPLRKPRFDQRQEIFPGAGKSQKNAMIVSSDESDISSLEQNESSKLKSNVKPSERRLEKQDKESREHGTKPTGEAMKHISKPKDDLQEPQAAQYSKKKKMGTLRNGSRKRGSADVSKERSVLRSLSKADEQSNSPRRRGLIGETTFRKSPGHAYDLNGLRDEGNYSARKTPDPMKPVRTTYSSGKSRKRQERDKFGALIEEEEQSSKKTLALASLLPSKRSAGLDTPQGDENRQLTVQDEDKMENSLPEMMLEKRIKRYDDTSEPADPNSAASLGLGDPVGDFDDVAAPAGLSSSSFTDQPISAALEPESSPLARHSGRNARVSSVESGWKANALSQNQRQERVFLDSGKPRVELPLEGRPSSPPSAKRAKAEATSTLRNMHGMLPNSVKKVQHDGIMSLLEPAIEQGRLDCGPVVPTVLDQPRLFSAKSLNNIQLSDAVPQHDVGKVATVISRIEPNVVDGSRSRVEGHLRSGKHQMEDSVARHDKDMIQHRRVQAQPKRSLSSNSKKVPEPPGADSKAITIHVPQQLLITSRCLQTPAQPLMDPFHGQASTPGRPKDETRFMRDLRKQMEENARAARIKRNDGSRGCADDDDPDRTLVDMIEDAFDMDSIEDKSSTAVVSSTGAEPNGHYEKMEWEKSLKPHQRDVFDVLTRISRHFIRHLIDSETAIEDILQDFEADGTHLIELMEETHRKEYDAQRKCLLEACTHISGALFHINYQVVEHEKQARTALLGNGWEKESSISKKHIPHLERMLNQMVDP